MVEIVNYWQRQGFALLCYTGAMRRSQPRGETQPRSPETDQLTQLLMHLGSRAFGFFGAVAADVGLAAPVAMALQRIEPSRPGPMNELAGAMGCDPSYVTWIADQLEANGLAERRLATHDRRVKVLALTPAGEAAREQLLDRLARAPFALDQLSTPETQQLSDLLRRVLGGESPDVDNCAVFAVRHHHNGDHRKQPAKATRASVATEG